MKRGQFATPAHPPIFCNRCLYSTQHPLGLTLNEQGICSGCEVHAEKNQLDWDTRWKNLESLVAPYRVESGKTYDCIVPVTGANDSYYIVHIVKNKLGLNPLLVNYNKYYNTRLGIRNLANLRIKFNTDLLIQSIDPKCIRRITRTTLRELGSVYWHCLAGHTVFPVQTAVRYKIPLIIWGAHQGLEQVGMFSHNHEVEMSRWYRKNHDLMGYEADDLLSDFDTISEDDVWQFRYPEDTSLREVDVRGVYLGNYVRWDPKAQHEEMVRMFDYSAVASTRTFDTYDHGDCFNYLGLHDRTKFLKHGFSKVTDHACREIRHGRLSRAQATLLVKKYQLGYSSHEDLFCDWLGIKKESLEFMLSQISRNRLSLSQATATTDHDVTSGIESKQIKCILEQLNFVSNYKVDTKFSIRYVTFGRGID